MSANSPAQNLIDQANDDPLLTPGEVAKICRVDPKTVTRWEKAGRIACVRTMGGHRRFRRSAVVAMLGGEQALVGQVAVD